MPLSDVGDIHRSSFGIVGREHLHINALRRLSADGARALVRLCSGIPEFETFSMNIDGLFSDIADAAGIVEQIAGRCRFLSPRARGRIRLVTRRRSAAPAANRRTPHHLARRLAPCMSGPRTCNGSAPDDLQRRGLGPGNRVDETARVADRLTSHAPGRRPSAVITNSQCAASSAAFDPGGAAALPEIWRACATACRIAAPTASASGRRATASCTLGHRRLSIIDLSDAAAQPMSNCAGTVTVTFNGEIYNHAELRRELEALGKYQWKTDHSDTEVLLHAYEEWGLDCVQSFYGMFAVGIYDARDPRRPVLHLIRDRVGDQTDLLHPHGRRRMAVRLGDPRARRPSRRHARDGSHRLLALPDLHRRAGAADDVPRHLQAAGRPRPDDRSPRRRERPAGTWDCVPDRAHRRSPSATSASPRRSPS